MRIFYHIIIGLLIAVVSGGVIKQHSTGSENGITKIINKQFREEIIKRGKNLKLYSCKFKHDTSEGKKKYRCTPVKAVDKINLALPGMKLKEKAQQQDVLKFTGSEKYDPWVMDVLKSKPRQSSFVNVPAEGTTIPPHPDDVIPEHLAEYDGLMFDNFNYEYEYYDDVDDFESSEKEAIENAKSGVQNVLDMKVKLEDKANTMLTKKRVVKRSSGEEEDAFDYYDDYSDQYDAKAGDSKPQDVKVSTARASPIKQKEITEDAPKKKSNKHPTYEEQQKRYMEQYPEFFNSLGSGTGSSTKKQQPKVTGPTGSLSTADEAEKDESEEDDDYYYDTNENDYFNPDSPDSDYDEYQSQDYQSKNDQTKDYSSPDYQSQDYKSQGYGGSSQQQNQQQIQGRQLQRQNSQQRSRGQFQQGNKPRIKPIQQQQNLHNAIQQDQSLPHAKYSSYAMPTSQQQVSDYDGYSYQNISPEDYTYDEGKSSSSHQHTLTSPDYYQTNPFIGPNQNSAQYGAKQLGPSVQTPTSGNPYMSFQQAPPYQSFQQPENPTPKPTMDAASLLNALFSETSVTSSPKQGYEGQTASYPQVYSDYYTDYGSSYENNADPEYTALQQQLQELTSQIKDITSQQSVQQQQQMLQLQKQQQELMKEKMILAQQQQELEKQKLEIEKMRILEEQRRQQALLEEQRRQEAVANEQKKQQALLMQQELERQRLFELQQQQQQHAIAQYPPTVTPSPLQIPQVPYGAAVAQSPALQAPGIRARMQGGRQATGAGARGLRKFGAGQGRGLQRAIGGTAAPPGVGAGRRIGAMGGRGGGRRGQGRNGPRGGRPMRRRGRPGGRPGGPPGGRRRPGMKRRPPPGYGAEESDDDEEPMIDMNDIQAEDEDGIPVYGGDGGDVEGDEEGGGEGEEDGESDVKIRYKYVAVDGNGQEIDEYADDSDDDAYSDDREVISYNDVIGDDGEVYQELGPPRRGPRMRGRMRGRPGPRRRRFRG